MGNNGIFRYIECTSLHTSNGHHESVSIYEVVGGGAFWVVLLAILIGLQPIKWCLFQISVANRDNNNFSVLKIGYEIQQLSNGKFIEF